MVIYPDPNPTATSNAKDIYCKSLVVKNADGTTTTDKAVIPADATILLISIVVPTGTATATLSIGRKGVGTTTYVNAQSVATAGQLWPTNATPGNLSGLPLGTDSIITTTVGTTAVTSDVYVNIFYTR